MSPAQNHTAKQMAKRHLERLFREGEIDFNSSPTERGVDLIANSDGTRNSRGESVCRVRLQVNSENRFEVQRKWNEIPNLMLVYAWDISEDSCELYGLSYKDAVSLLEQRGHTKTYSWNKLRGFSHRVGSGEANKWWRTHLAPYRLAAENIRAKLKAISPAQS